MRHRAIASEAQKLDGWLRCPYILFKVLLLSAVELIEWTAFSPVETSNCRGRLAKKQLGMSETGELHPPNEANVSPAITVNKETSSKLSLALTSRLPLSSHSAGCNLWVISFYLFMGVGLLRRRLNTFTLLQTEGVRQDTSRRINPHVDARIISLPHSWSTALSIKRRPCSPCSLILIALETKPKK